MEYAISAVWTLLELLGQVFWLRSFLQPRKRPLGGFPMILLSWLLYFLLAQFILDSYIKLAVMIILITSLSLYLHKGSFPMHFLCALLCLIIGTLLDSLFIYGFCALSNISPGELFTKKLLYTLFGTMSKLLYFFLIYLLYRVRRPLQPEKIFSKWLVLSLAFPLASICMAMVLVNNSMTSADLTLSTFVFFCVLAAANIALLYLLNLMERAARKERDHLLLQQQMDIQLKNTLALEESYSRQRKATHEFNRHLRMLRSLLEQNSAAEALDYLDKLQTPAAAKSASAHSGHAILDAVLTQALSESHSLGISFDLRVDDLSKLTVEPQMLVVLLSNLLENAIEACTRQTEDNRKIICHLQLDDKFYLSVRNTTAPVSIVDGTVKTTKTPAQEHGYGLPAVYQLLERLNGEHALDYSDGWFTFAAEIPLCMPPVK